MRSLDSLIRIISIILAILAAIVIFSLISGLDISSVDAIKQQIAHIDINAVIFIGIIIVIMSAFMLPSMIATAPISIKNGIATTATIIDAENTGEETNNNILFNLLLEVQTKEGTTYQVARKRHIPAWFKNQLLDLTVHVIYDPINPERINITKINFPTQIAVSTDIALERLAALHKKGTISDDEFYQRRERILQRR